MKKKMAFISGLILGLFSMTSITSAATTGVFSQGSANNINVYFNDQLLTLNVPAKVINNRTMVPLRGVFESMGAQVQWEQSTRSILISKDSTTIELSLNSTTAKVNGQSTTLDVAPTVVNDRTLVPIHFISQALGANVQWDSKTDSVFVALRPLPSTNTLSDYIQSILSYVRASDEAEKASSEIYLDYEHSKITYDQFKTQYDAQVKIMQDSYNSIKNTAVPDDNFAKIASNKFIGVYYEKYMAHADAEGSIYSDHVDSAALEDADNLEEAVYNDISALNAEYSTL